MKENKKQKIFLIDGNSLLYRAYFATGALSNNLDFPTNALYGLSNMLIRILEKKPTYVVAAFDTKAPTFRHKMFADYKAQRKPPEAQLVMQMEPARDLVRAFGITVIEMPGYEGDDIIGTIAKESSKKGLKTCVWTGDLDSLQLVDENVNIYHTVRGVSDVKIYDSYAVFERYGVTVDQFVDFKGLKGDSSDNIPGVPGIGDKTAEKLISEFNSIEGIYENIDTMKESKIKRNLVEFKDQAFLSKTLSRIDTNIPIEFDYDAWKFNGYNDNELYKLAKLYQFYSIMHMVEPSEEEVEEEIVVEDIETTKIENDKDLDKLVKDLETESEISIYFDFVPETNRFISCSIYTEKLGLFKINMEKEESLLDMIVFDEPFYLDINILKPILENENIKKIVFKSKDLIKILANKNISIKNIAFDTYLGSYIRDCSKVEDNIKKLSYSLFTKELGENAYSNFLIYKELYSNLEKSLNLDLLLNVEQPLAYILAQMEMTGIQVDRDKLKDLSIYLDTELKKLETKIYELAGKEFNIQSPKQLATVLFEDLEIPFPKKTKKYSTGVEILEKLVDYEIIRYIMEYREMAKIKSTYSDSLINQINLNTGRVHTTYMQAATSTGRLSSVNPNLQNIPNKEGVGMKVREAFVATKGYSLVSCDYSQVEFRLFAHITEDKELIKAFVNGVDFHTATAMNIFDTEEVTKDMRKTAKTLNFAILYGMGPYNLSQQLNISVKEANDFIKDYFKRFPAIKETKAEILWQGKDKGYVSTICNRRLYTPDLNAGNHFAKAAQERAAINMPFQGSAADIMKIAMIKVANRIKEEKLDIKILLQVHDELVCECPDELAQTCAKLVKEEMEKAFVLKVPLIAEAKIGKDWANMEKL